MRHDEDTLGLDAADLERIGGILAELGESDLELLAPPDDLWGRIEAAVTSMPARRAPARTTPAPLVVEYRIDATDVVTDVGGGWADFARSNGAADLAVPDTERELWSYFGRSEFTDLWQTLVQRVREVRRPAHVPFRCDAPDARRWFEMTITPEPAGAVHFVSALVFEERRTPVALLDMHAARDLDEPPIPICSWCGRGQSDGAWQDLEELVRAERLLEQSSMPPIVHGICEACRDEMSAELLVPDAVGTEPG